MITVHIIYTPDQDVKIKCCPGKSLVVADVLNRLYLMEKNTDGTVEQERKSINMLHYLCIWKAPGNPGRHRRGSAAGRKTVHALRMTRTSDTGGYTYNTIRTV